MLIFIGFINTSPEAAETLDPKDGTRDPRRGTHLLSETRETGTRDHKGGTQYP